MFGIIFLMLMAQPQEGKAKSDTVNLRANYISMGMTAYSGEHYREAIGYFKKAFKLDSLYSALTYNIACCYSLLNLKDSAVVWLDKTVGLGAYEFEGDSDFDNIRKSKEFKEIVLRATRLLEEAKKKEWKTLVFKPEDYNPEKKYPLFIGLHGYGGSADNFLRAVKDYINKKGYILAIPYGTEVQGLTSFSWGSINKCKEKIMKDIKEIESKYSIDTTRIILLGYSQGGSRAASLGITNPDVFKGIIAIASSFDKKGLKKYIPNLKEKEIGYYIIIGGKEREERLESNKKAKQLLEKNGVKVHLKIYPEIGHAFPPDPEEAIGTALRFLTED